MTSLHLAARAPPPCPRARMGAAACAKNGGSRISIGGGLGCCGGLGERKGVGGVLRNLKLHLQNKYRF